MGFFVSINSFLRSLPPPWTGEGRGEGEEIAMGYGHDQVIPCIK